MTTQTDQLQLEFDRPPLQLLTPDEIYDRIDEEMLRTLFEDNRTEFKSSGIHAKALGDYFGMWGNTAPSGGIVVVGVREEEVQGRSKRIRVVEGCAGLTESQLNDLEAAGSTFCPDAVYASKRMLVHRDSDHGSDFVVVLRVKYHPSKVVKTVSGEVFKRISDQKKLLKTVEEINHLRGEKGEIRVEMDPSGLAYPRGFDSDAIADFVSAVRSKKGWSENHSTEDVLELMHLGHIEQRKFAPNLACAILFAADPRAVIPGCRIRFLRFEGEVEGVGEKWNAVKDEWIEGTLPQQIEGADRMLKSQLRNFSRLGIGGKFFTTAEYPDFAWYEAVVNACVHRSYGNGIKNMPIFVKMFDDRLVIESPGPFPAFVTAQNIYDVHMPRNPYLMDAMYFLKFVRCAHEGTRRIRATMLASDLPAPEFKQDEVGHAIVRVTLRNNIKQRKVWVDSDVVALLGAQIALALTEDEKRCINFCAEYGRISVSDTQRLTTKSWAAAKKILNGLVQKGIMDHQHRDNLERDPGARFILRVPKLPHGEKGKK